MPAEQKGRLLLQQLQALAAAAWVAYSQPQTYCPLLTMFGAAAGGQSTSMFRLHNENMGCRGDLQQITAVLAVHQSETPDTVDG
jgi:formyltetrahydrofolate synthetase